MVNVLTLAVLARSVWKAMDTVVDTSSVLGTGEEQTMGSDVRQAVGVPVAVKRPAAGTLVGASASRFRGASECLTRAYIVVVDTQSCICAARSWWWACVFVLVALSRLPFVTFVVGASCAFVGSLCVWSVARPGG